ncbi:hypothetical protein [Maliponia aquimaris]|uniref:Inorganic polyphosphate/ATP-NAD kinase n=1 Tax=Maliponia aquimaris TaxID=1673631 RepID=A0A238JQZ0_9RHOB|nr:hypothetical protein [Maliponia aquimaris]SMX32156.1 inorganic polyphosphate/ATP-NAD kinase [Maliponia aquimaris]
MSSLKPRVVIVTRETELEALLARLGTRGQAEFYLASRGQQIAQIESRAQAQRRAVDAVKTAVPAEWSLAQVARGDLDRFLFFPNDVVVAVGQDGLVANLAKYLDGQPVIGVTPDPESSEGVLVRHGAATLPGLLPRVAARDMDGERRTMIEARVNAGGALLGLNDLFIGHRSHQSARYDLRYGEAEEFQSSSGVVVATGTGLSGWARSIMTATGADYDFSAVDPAAAFFAREPWPSRTSGDRLRSGQIGRDKTVQILSRINEGGVIFADGLEQDYLPFDWGTRVEIGISARSLLLVA